MIIREKKFADYKWIDITDLKEQDVEQLTKEYHFHHLAIEDCLSAIQRPKIDIYPDHIFMVFHLPRYLKTTYRTVASEIDVFLGKNYLVTIHQDAVKPIDELFVEVEKENPKILTHSSAYLLYELLDKVFGYCFPMLDRIGEKLDAIEVDLYRNHSRRTLEDISFIELDVINFRRIINPQRYVIKDLEAKKVKLVGEKLDVYFDDIVDKIERIWDILDSYKDVCSVLKSTSESFVTHRLNEIIKILTIFSVLMLPLTVFTGFYGMNIADLPLATHNNASEIMVSILILIVTTMLLFFRKKRWL
jgi:magnesium transporter